ncbi:dipeptide epimerase [Pacificimonas sp. ICDLI1SI03]
MSTDRLTMSIAVEDLKLNKPFRISGHLFTSTPVAVVTLSDGDNAGRGEATGVYYLDDNLDTMIAALQDVRGDIEAGIGRAGLQDRLPAGGARNALDCAYWELEARQTRRAVWDLAGIGEPRPLLTAFTLGAEAPDLMANAAADYSIARALKLKLTGDLAVDSERVRAVSRARPDCWLGVDANQGYDVKALAKLLPVLEAAGVSLLEQPLPRGAEADLDGFKCSIPLAADESALTRADLSGLVGRFDVVNIKLDKSGGLTEALAMAETARQLGLDVMVGNMTGSSLAMAPAFILGQLCDIVDLDGPTFLAQDRELSIEYRDGTVWCPETVWGWCIGAA